DRVRPARLRAGAADPRPRQRAQPAARQRRRTGRPRNRARRCDRPRGRAPARPAFRPARAGAADRRRQHRRPARSGQGRRTRPRARRAHPYRGLWRRRRRPVRPAPAGRRRGNRRSRAGAHRRHHRRARFPGARYRRAGRDLRRDRPARTGAAAGRGGTASGRTLPLAAGCRAAGRPAGDLAAASPRRGRSASRRTVGRGARRMIESLAQLHFVRPHWLWALVALPALAAWWHWQRRRASVWREHVDAHLLPHLVEPGASRSGLGGLAVRLLACALAALALAGPSWRQGEVALQQGGRALVVALDLSDAMLAADLPPSRLAQARAWLARLLAAHEGEVGLLAFADDAFTVAPVTGDAANVTIFLDALAPDVMPVDGHRPDRAIHAAMALLAQAGHRRGDILLITHGADEATAAAAARAQAAGLRVSVLGLGRPAGASYRARDGSLRPSRLDVASLQRVAAAGGGEYASLAQGADALAALSPASFASGGESSRTLAGSKVWRDDGYWLLLPLMLLVLLAFRRGVALLALGACLLLPPQLHAAEAAQGTPWRRADQVEHLRMREGLDAYRAGRHDEAERIWQGLPGADAAYNRGNALARAGRLEDAIEAYDEALRRQPGMEDAIANRAVVEAALQRQPPQGPGAPRQQPDAGDE